MASAYSMAGREPREIILPAGAAKSRQLRPEHMLDFESLKAEPDQLLTYFFWAEDIGPDGQPRRTSGDMFFAEVRPFEEIFRQGEQPPSGSAENEEQEGQQGNAQASDQLGRAPKGNHQRYLEADSARDDRQADRRSSPRTPRCWKSRKRVRSSKRASLPSGCKTPHQRPISNRRLAR